MSEWSEFTDKAEQFLDKANREAVRLGDTAALHVKIKLCETRIANAYENLGKLTYAKLRENADNASQIDAALARIDELNDECGTMKRELEKLKKTAEKSE